jgi:hypothetical protein
LLVFDRVELAARDHRVIARAHPFAEAGDEAAVARDDEERPALRVIASPRAARSSSCACPSRSSAAR